MAGFLSRVRPRHPVLAVLFWVAVVVLLLAALSVAFFYLDDYLPGQGMI